MSDQNRTLDLRQRLREMCEAGLSLQPDDHASGEQLEAYVDGTLTEPQREPLAAHLAVCPLCFETALSLQTWQSNEWDTEVMAVPDSAGARVSAIAAAKAAWQRVATGGDSSRWTILPADLSYAGGAFASPLPLAESPVHHYGDSLRWWLTIEAECQVIYVQATRPVALAVLLYDQHGVMAPERGPLSLEPLDFTETRFVWRARAELGRLDDLSERFGAFQIAVVVGE